MDENFARDILLGLKATPKRLSSKYFYDSRGDELFRQIMELPEYYLTRAEYSILDRYSHELYQSFSAEGSKEFDLIELGAGDGTKTKLLLDYFIREKTEFTYYPVDISANVLSILHGNLQKEFPQLKAVPIQKEYFEAIQYINGSGRRKKAILFLGSNIGNFDELTAKNFLKQLSDALQPGDDVLIGFDCKKDPWKIQKAYADDSGVTKAFNLNLLLRVNRELHADFDVENFVHYASYNPEDGKASSYLVSKCQQSVKILDEVVNFREWESIHVEISQKFDPLMIERLADNAGFRIQSMFFDEKKYFVDALWQKK